MRNIKRRNIAEKRVRLMWRDEELAQDYYEEDWDSIDYDLDLEDRYDSPEDFEQSDWDRATWEDCDLNSL
jgi:hypothetical protein